MKHLPAILFIAAAVLCGSVSSPAQAAPILDFAVRVGCDFQQPEKGLMDLHVLQGSTPLVLAMPKAGNTALTPDADTSVRMVIGPYETGSIYAVRTNYAIAGGGYAIDWPTIGTNSSGQAWFYTLLFDREGKTYWSGSGALYIDASGYTGPDGVDWIEYTTPNVGWPNIVGDPGENPALVAYLAEHGGGSTEDAVARAGVSSNAADIAIIKTGKLDKTEAASAYQPIGDYATGTPLYVETYLGTILGATINPPHTVATNDGLLAFTIGALTEETDAIALAQAPTNVVCAGGWYWPDYFDVDPIPRPESYTAYGTTSAYNSVRIVPAEHSTVTDYLIQPVIARQQDWTSELAFSDFVNVELSAQGDGKWLATWLPETEDGSTGSFYATLGDFSRQINLIRGTVGNVSTSYLWVADLPGSLRESINSQTLAAASAEGAEQAIYAPWPYAAASFVRNPDAWTAGFDLTCASPWNSGGGTYGNYRPATAVTPQHVVGAAHWFAATGSVYRFVDATNGVHERTLVDRRFLPNDVAVGLLDSPLGGEIAPATILSANQIGYLRGKSGIVGAPGLYLVSLDAQERAWLSKTPLMERADSFNWIDASVSFTGSTNLPLSRYEAVGGDSGNPVFMMIGTNAVLLSCFYTATSGPFHTLARSAIESAMADMGGSVYTNVPAPDLSSWTNYDAGIEMPDF